MGKHKKMSYIEIVLILAILAIFVVWLFPRFLKILDSVTSTIGNVKSYVAVNTGSVDIHITTGLAYPKINRVNQNIYFLSDPKGLRKNNFTL